VIFEYEFLVGGPQSYLLYRYHETVFKILLVLAVIQVKVTWNDYVGSSMQTAVIAWLQIAKSNLMQV